MKNNGIMKNIYGKRAIDKIQIKLDMLGTERKFDALSFINIRVLSSFILFIAVLYNNGFGYIFAPFFTVVYYFLFYFAFIEVPLNRRTKKLDKEALHFFEILTLTLESGRNLERSLSVAVNNIDSELSDEFKKALNEVQYGKSLIEALDDMKKRIPSETINNIILNITQTSVFGSSILDTLYSQVDFLRDKQLLDIKGQINKIPNKISIISVIFIVPLILIMILGPFLLTYFK